MLGPEHCEDGEYARLLQAIGETGDIPEHIESAFLREMIARGLGIDVVPSDRSALYALIESGRCVTALTYDLTFPEVFYPTGVPLGRQGFHAVLGNPPWDALQPLAKEFFAAFDFDILAAPTRREREITEKRLLSNEEVKAAFESYVESIDGYKAYVLSALPHVNKTAGGKNSGAITDLWQCFAERAVNLVARFGQVGLVLPSAFHANEGATGIRDLMLNKLSLRHCYSFENRRKLFEIHASFKFATVVAQSGKPTECFDCAFYLHDDEWLFGDRKGREPLPYTLDFVPPYRRRIPQFS